MNRLTTLSLASVLIPLLSLMIAASVILYEAQRAQRLEMERQQTVKQIALLEKLTKELEAQPRLNKTPSVGQSPKEQPEFLNMLRLYASLSRVQLTRFANTGAAVANTTTAGNDATHRELPPNVTAVACDIAVAGRFDDIRKFLDCLQRAPRLYNLSNLKWARDDKWPTTHLSFTLNRYLGPPDPLTAGRMQATVLSPALSGNQADAANSQPAIGEGAAAQQPHSSPTPLKSEIARGK
jgi:Tfp pilus assembly protein PilO